MNIVKEGVTKYNTIDKRLNSFYVRTNYYQYLNNVLSITIH